MDEKLNTPTFAFPKITAEWPDIQTDRIEYTDPFKEDGNPIDEIWLRISTIAEGRKYAVEYKIVLGMDCIISEDEHTKRLKWRLRDWVATHLKNHPLVGEDSEGNELRAGDKAELIILNVGSGVVEIVTHGGVLQMYCPSQGYYPLNAVLLRQDMHLEKIQEKNSKPKNHVE